MTILKITLDSAQSILGLFQLKNIQDPMEIFAVSNRGITVPEYEPKTITPPEQSGKPKIVGGRKKWVAGLLGIFLGIFGIHRFYLGHRLLGFAFLGAFLIGAFSGEPDADFLVPVAAIGGFCGWTVNVVYATEKI